MGQSSRSRDIYISPSPNRNRVVGLILNQKTGLVSPQFHIKYDNNFDTVKELDVVEDWKIRAGFVAQRERRENEDSITPETH